MATERLIVAIDENGALVVKRRLDETGESARRAEGGVTLLRRALGLLGAAVTLRALIQLSDQFTNIQNRLRTVVSGEQQLASTTAELLAIANRTRSSFEGTAELYARLGLAAKDLGVGQQQLARFTESVNQAIILSGASGAEAQAGLIQLSQGLSSGALRGDELRSVLEQLPAVADVIARNLGVTRGELRKMGEQGKITAKVVLDAFEAAREELSERFAKTVPTISQAFQVLRNNVTALVGSFNTNTGAAGSFAKVILFLANNLGPAVSLVKALGIALAITFAPQLLGLAAKGIATLALQMTSFNAAMTAGSATVIPRLLKSLGTLKTEFIALGRIVLANPLIALGAALVGGAILGIDALNRKMDEAEKFQDKAHDNALRMIRARRAEVVANKEAADSFTKYIDALRLENQLLKLNEKDREVREALLEAEKQAGQKLTPQQERMVTSLIREKQTLEELQKPLEDRISALVRVRDTLKSIAQFEKDPLAGKGPKLEGVDKTPLGIDQGDVELPKIVQSATQDLSQMEQVGLGALESLTSGFASLIQSTDGFGESLRALFQNMAASVAGAIAQLLIVQGLLSLFPGLSSLGGMFASAVPTKAQHGGSFMVGGHGGPDSKLVSFQATPGERFDVTPPGKEPPAAAAPEVNVKVVPVMDPRSMIDALNSPAGERVIMAVVQRNPTMVRRALGGGGSG